MAKLGGFANNRKPAAKIRVFEQSIRRRSVGDVLPLVIQLIYQSAFLLLIYAFSRDSPAVDIVRVTSTKLMCYP